MLLTALMPYAATAIAAPVQSSNYPGNQITITGNSQEFKITNDNNQLFNITNMLPGERSDLATITIANTQDLPFTVSIAVSDEGSNSDLLLNYLDILVLLNGNVIANFPAKGQTGNQALPNPYPIGRIPASTTTNIQVGLEFANAANAQNNLQETAAHLVWTITAVSDQPEADPIITDPNRPDPITPDPLTLDPLTPDPNTPDSVNPNNPNQNTPAPAPGAGGILGGFAAFISNITGTDAAQTNTPAPAPTAPTTTLPELTNVPQAETPLSNTNLSEDVDKAWALLNLLLTLGSIALALIALLLRSRKCEEQAATNKSTNAATSNTAMAPNSHTASLANKENENQRNSRLPWRIGGIVAAILAIVLFILTEDITLPIRWTDIWTPAHIVIFLLVLAILPVTQRKANKAREQTAAG
jgi:hypothetical protein